MPPRRSWCSLLILAVASCASSPGPLNRAALRATHPRTIVASLRPIPPFHGRTSTAQGATAPFALLGLLVGAALADAEGQHIRAKHVYDPADAISAALMDRMVRRFSLEVIDAGKVATLSDLRALTADAHKRGMKVLLDIVTNHMGQVFYYDMNMNGHPDIYVGGTGQCSPRVSAPSTPSTPKIHRPTTS